MTPKFLTKLYFLQKKIACLKQKVVDLSVSVNHSAFTVAGGYVVTMGDNKEAQLGLGHTKDAATEPSIVKKIAEKFITVRDVCDNKTSNLS